MNKKTLLTITTLFALSFAINAQETIKKDTSQNQIAKSESFPEFPGGDDALKKFVIQNRQYENEKDKKRTVGTVFVSFVIEKDGSIGEPIKVERSLSEYYDKEAIRIVKLLPKWKPAMQNENPVRILFHLPVKF